MRAEEKERVRLSLDVSAELNRTLEDIAARLDGTKSDVLRKAIALLEVAVEAKERGKPFGIADKEEHLVTRIVGL